MADKVKTYPESVTDALAMLYLQNQDLKGKTPAEIHTMYWEARKEIQTDYKIKLEEKYVFSIAGKSWT